MPIDRYQIRNVYSLADQELYKAADKDDPEALLEGVAMAGLVGVLRQLGDLAEFAAEIFQELHEEVTATAARGNGLLVRAQQLELEIPSIQRSFMSQTCHSAFFTNSGVDWHPNLKTTPNLITTGDLPRFVMNSYEECRGPPRLFLLDKFDVGGDGVCLKRYTDPSFYKVEVSSNEIENAEIQRDKKIRKNKKKGSQCKVGGTPEISPNSKAKLHQLFMEDRMQNSTTEYTHRVKLKKRPNKSPFDSESYMNKLLKSPSSKGKIVHPLPFHPSIIPVPFDSPNQIFKDTIGSPFNLATPSRSPSVSSSAENTGCRIPADNLAGKVIDRKISDLTNSGSPDVNEEIKTDGVQNGYRSDDVASEMDNYVDALGTMESGLQFQFSDSQLTRSTGILFPPQGEKTSGTSYDVNEGVVLEEDENVKNEENQTDFHSPAGSLLSFQFLGNFEGEVEHEHEHPNDGSSPMIHPPSILETADKINEDNHNHSTKDDSVVEETLDSCEKFSLPEQKLNEIGDDEAKVSSFIEDEKELKERETGLVNSETTPDDVDRNDNKALSMLEDDTKSEGTEEDSVDPKMEKNVVVLLPLDVNTNENNARNDENALPTLEDDTPLEVKGDEDSVDLEEMKSIPPDLDEDDVNGNDDNALSTHSLLEQTNENGEKTVVLNDIGSQPMTVTEKPPMLELPPSEMEDKEDPQLLFASAGSQFSSQSDSPSHDIDQFDQVNHQLPPVKPEDTPPLPPLPPMQWRMRKLESPMLTPTDGGQLKVNEIKNTEIENEKFENEGSLHAQDHDKKSASTEVKFSETLAPKEAVDEIPNNIRPMKIQRPRNPLIDAVATHDKSKLRKVLAMSQITKGQENDKLLEQIRTKSYNLKPPAQTRPNIQGPTTNVRIAAILEKANAIRQAFAGSDDDDDDSDSWSDS
ncbi:unnamed protein product [Lactuca saligna]|uniref:Protein SCAR n=1 Tax=Lactuca saligna TaxID=75948 RepID=A0AA35ZTT4_LACSI|nr:unnamed protein product [Lactuca saligna]